MKAIDVHVGDPKRQLLPLKGVCHVDTCNRNLSVDTRRLTFRVADKKETRS